MRKMAWSLAVVTLVGTLTGCSRRGEYEKLYESMREDESRRQETAVIGVDTTPEREPVDISKLPNEEGYRLSVICKEGDTGTYEGLTSEELCALFTPRQVSDQEMFNSTLTPLGVVFQSSDDSGFYNKLSGQVAPLCPDPLCDGDDCVFAMLPQFLYIGREHMYFTVYDRSENLYRCDLTRNHVELLCKDFPNAGAESNIWAEDGDTVYVTMPVYREGEAAVMSFGKLDAKTKEYTPLSGEREVLVKAVAGDSLWFVDKDDADRPLYRTNLQFEDPVRVEVEGEIINFSDQYIVFGHSNGFSMVPDRLYCIATDTYTELSGNTDRYLGSLSGDYVYYKKAITDEEIADSPLRDYYEYETEIVETRPMGMHRPPDERVVTVVCQNLDAGRIWRTNLVSGEEECVLELTYNGVPVRIQNVVGDGSSCFFTYSTYEDYNNYFHSDYPSANDYEPVHFAIADFGNGTVRFADTVLMGE